MDTPIAPRARWPEPQPVPRGRPPVPALNGALLPGALAPWVADVTERVQCPPDFVGVGVLVAAAAVALTGSPWPDIVVGLLVAGVFGHSAVQVIREASRAVALSR